jgi:hypothetical protein
VTAGQPPAPPPEPAEPQGPEPAPRKPKRDPVGTLNLALLVYLGVTTVFAVPLLLFPAAFYDLIGVSSRAAAELGGLRWVGGMLAAWVVSGVLVLASPSGRAIFVTTGALQLSFGAAAFVYSWITDDFLGYTWFNAIVTLVLIAAAVYLWWARFRARAVLHVREET